jgi:hypothetical protein
MQHQRPYRYILLTIFRMRLCLIGGIIILLVVIIVPSGTFHKDGIRRPELTYFCSGGNPSLNDKQVIVGEG